MQGLYTAPDAEWWKREGWQKSLEDFTAWADENIGHLKRSGRHYQPDNQREKVLSPDPVIEKAMTEKRKEPIVEKDRVLKQLKKIQADISIWGLLKSSYEHRQAVLNALEKILVPINTLSEALVSLVASKPQPTLKFTNVDLPQEGSAHNHFPHILVSCMQNRVPVVLVVIGPP